MTLQICVVQLNFVVGDMPGNARKIIDAAQQAYAEGARLVLTPELSICGYAAEDLYLRPAFNAACDDAVKQVAQALAGLKDLCVVVGHPAGTMSGPLGVRFAPLQCGQRVVRRAGAGHLRQARAAQLPGFR
jgi:predicted amidohydrolase